ncbi:hypothetical protein DFH29DRAFT_876028 [Suillus ampliporus]|nr:hypothetical protein DFH29DRAFT_876028 [Suillus ampliporus]
MDFAKLFATLSSIDDDVPRSTTRPTRKPKFVKFLPGDIGEGMPEIFFEDPRTFKPKPGPHGQIQTWGLFPYCKDNIWDFEGVQMIWTHQMSYDNHGGKPWPEKQFLDVLKDRKREQLRKLDLADLDKKDIVIKIHLKLLEDANGDPRIWRRVRLSAGMKIGVFQDKVLSPVLNWVRNLHCYTFTDLRDGALFGPEGSRLDMITFRMTSKSISSRHKFSNWDHENHGYWQETTSSTKDKRSQSACAACGKPGGQDLKTCSGCRAILYCSPEHQKAHWKDVHKKQCSRKYLKK